MNKIKEQNQPSVSGVEHEDEIDLIALVRTLWDGRRIVIRTTLLFMAVGLMVALFSAKEYTATTTMLPQSSDEKKLGGNLGGLAAMAGINLGSMVGGSDIPPTLYPQIVKSIPFQKELMQTKITVERQEQVVTFADYYAEIYRPGLFGYIKKYTIGLPDVISKAMRGDNTSALDVSLNWNSKGLIQINEDEKKLIEILLEQIFLEVNDKDGYISLSARMPEALPAAQLALHAQELLQKAIIEFKSQKAKDQLAFVEERYVEKQKEFELVQNKLANFRDRNRNVSTALAQTELERLQAEYNLVYGVYSELAKQLETQRIQVKEDTPVFTILEPVSVPVEKSKPKRAIILIIWIFFGGIVGVGLVFGKEFFVEIKGKWCE